MFKVVTKAGLSAAEFGRIVGVSRIAVYNWMNRGVKPHRLIEARVGKALALVNLLLKKEKLPLAAGLDKDARRAKIDKIKDILNSN